MKEPSYYAVIPSSVRYDKKLMANAKLLYAEITALSNQKGFCWATDRYFADLYGVSKQSIQTRLKSLEKNGYIKRVLKYKEGTKEILNRYIRILDPAIKENFITPTKENLGDNTTSNNTTSNTIMSLESDEEDGFILEEDPMPVNTKKNDIKVEDAIVKWNTIGIFKKCRGVTKDIETAWRKIQKNYTKEQLNIGLTNYRNDIMKRNPEHDYANHRFSFYEFRSQKNGFKRFLNM